MPAPLNPEPRRLQGRCLELPSAWHPVSAGSRSYLIETQSLAAWRADCHEWTGLMLAHPRVSVPKPPERPCARSCAQLVLNLTSACNLRCRYCFVRHGEAAMRPVTALGAVRAAFPEGNPRIGFFGGEPLLAWPVMEEVFAAFPEARYSLTTNGTLLTPEICAELARHGTSVILSLDGDASRHDLLRPYADGRGSHGAATHGLCLLAEAGIRPTLRGTFTRGGLDLAAELERLNALCDTGAAEHVSIEPAGMGEACGNASAVDAADLIRLEPEFRAAAEWAIGRARAGQRARYHHLNLTLRRFLRRSPAWTECGAGNAYLTVNANGEVHACHRELSLVGHLARQHDLRSGEDAWSFEWLRSRESWIDNRLSARARCADCAWRHACGGGCRMDALANGRFTEPDPAGCELTRLRAMMALMVLDALGPETAGRFCA